MKKIISTPLVIATLILTTFFTAQSLSAEEKSFSSVSTFSTSSGRIGFFDNATGKVYIYDNDAKNCVFIGQLETLGEPIKEIMKTDPTIKNDLKAKKFERI